VRGDKVGARAGGAGRRVMRGVCTWGGKVGSVVQGCVCVWLGGGAKGGPRVNEAGRAFAVRWIKGAQQTVFFAVRRG
jgi:hypothetical protein